MHVAFCSLQALASPACGFVSVGQHGFVLPTLTQRMSQTAPERESCSDLPQQGPVFAMHRHFPDSPEAVRRGFVSLPSSLILDGCDDMASVLFLSRVCPTHAPHILLLCCPQLVWQWSLGIACTCVDACVFFSTTHSRALHVPGTIPLLP